MQSTRRNLPQLLGDARRWFEEGLLAALEAAGATPVSPTQAQLFAVLDDQGATVSELARRMGAKRQTVHQAVHGLRRRAAQASPGPRLRPTALDSPHP